MKKLLIFFLVASFLATTFVSCAPRYNTSGSNSWKPYRPKYVDYTKPTKRPRKR